jgi:hypothetical protein
VRAIEAACAAVARNLSDAWAAEPLPGIADAGFAVALPEDLEDAGPGVSIVLYRVDFSQTGRSTSLRSGGPRGGLGVDLRVLLVPGAEGATQLHGLIGWTARVLGSRPTLSAETLNSGLPGTFEENDTVEVVADMLSPGELAALWRSFDQDYRVALPFLIRGVTISTEASVKAVEPRD